MDPKIEVQDLKAVVEVAEQGSFARAAEALWVSRATMSEQIKGVERVLEVRLFDRTTRSVKPTPAGLVFVEHASRLLVELASMADAVRAAGEQPRGIVRFGLPAGVVTQRIWHIISIFRRDHPAIELEFTETTTDELVRSIQKRELDLSIVAWPFGHTSAAIETAELTSDRTGVAVASDHPLATAQGDALEKLRDISLVTFTRGYALRAIAEDFCQRAGLEPDIALQSAVDETVAGLVRAKVGYTITTLRQAEQERLTILPTKVQCLDRVVSLAWPKQGRLTPVASKLRDRIVEGFQLHH